MTGESAWKLRFTTPKIEMVGWAARVPERVIFVSNESGSLQAWTHDLGSGERRRATDEPVGVEHALITPDGEGVVWWHDPTGDERGRWVVAPWTGGEPDPLLEGIPDGWSTGVAMVPDTTAIGIALEDGYVVFVAVEGGEPLEIYRHAAPAGVGREWPSGSGGLSADGALLCIRLAEHSDILHPALRVLDVRTGEVLGDLRDPGHALSPVAWSPVPGDRRLAFASELGAFERPAIWNLDTGTRRDLEVDLPGAVIPVDWWPDASALLIRHEHEGRDQLCRLDLDGEGPTVVAETGGEIPAAAVRPDGEVWMLTSDSGHPQRIIASDGRTILAPSGDPAPAGRPYGSFWFENRHGNRIQAFVVTPAGDGPWPTVMSVHGGPEWHERDRFDPETQAFVDHGFAVALVNYRGSTGYGIAFRRALIGDPWFPETEDVVSGLDALVAAGISDPQRVAFAGWSWGGCLGCLSEGLHPDRWKAVFAGIPSGDFVAAHRACMPELQAYDVALYGGTPDELPEMYRQRNPMTYVDSAKAPVRVIAGENDPRCPIEGITPWVQALRNRGVPVDLHLYPEGHHANAVDRQVLHMQTILEFFGRHLG